jgi:hypothetical protein
MVIEVVRDTIILISPAIKVWNIRIVVEEGWGVHGSLADERK